MTVHCAAYGFVFKREDRLEADRVFSVFTRDFGRIEVTGRSIRKIASKLRSGIEIFSFCEFEFVEGRYAKTLTDVTATKKFGRLLKSLEQFSAANRISSLIEECIKGQERDSEILTLIADVFEKLSSQGKPQLAYQYFFWNFISMLGYTPELSVCAKCHLALNPVKLFISYKEGGVLCQNCKGKDDIAIAADTVKILRLIVKKDWAMLSRVKMTLPMLLALEQIADTYYSHRIEHAHY